ncbi:MAG: RNA polymerase sigma factor [Actinomycetes bacterium]
MPVRDLDLLVDAARAGGGWAFGRLWEALSPSVAGYLRARGVRDVDDLTSEVFLAAFRGLRGFSGDAGAFRSWLFTIAHHKAVDELRRGPRTREIATDIIDDGRVSASAEDAALEGLGDADAIRLLGTLSAAQRDVLLLRVVADLSLEETATALGKPVGAVKQLQRRALAGLRRTLAAQPITSDDPLAIATVR